ncbi:MAG: methyltransferase domain-containing protein [Planctomycetes bacterium]|nr:methyltransferase domain-containing protein [Planctomycetota bacterium]MCB9906036.1 methyltransferase domain-containing protein [Planctomycetota bacterium]
MSHEKIANLFDDWAKSGRGERMQIGHGDVVEQVVADLDVRPGHQILDLGCGVGWATRILAQKAPGAQAIGIDVAPEMIAKAEELSSYTIRARYEVGTFEHLDFPDEKFDHVFSMEALYYATDLPQALREIHRVTKTGGEVNVVIDCYAERESTHAWGHTLGLDLHVLSEADWKQAFEHAGFTHVELTRVKDRRGAGVEGDFQASEHFPSWEEHVAYHEAGSLRIRAKKPF